jgi:hypothetical protein
MPEVSEFTGKAEDAPRWLLGLHDRVTKLFPEICALEKAPETLVLEGAPAEVVAAEEELVPEEGAVVPAVLDANATATPQKLDLTGQAEPVVTAIDPEELARAVEAILAPREEAHKNEIAELRKQLDEIAAEPDPNKAPHRGTSVVARTPDEERPSALKAAQERSEDEYDGYLERQAQAHPSPEVRQRAQEQLEKRAAARASAQTAELVKA